MSTSPTPSNSPLLLTNGSLTFAPDFTGLQTYTATVPSTWVPVAGAKNVELPQIGLWIGEPGLGPANAIGQIANANQTLIPQTGVLTSNFTADNCLWAITTVVNPEAPEVAIRVERTSLFNADDSDSASYSADTPPRQAKHGSGQTRDLLLDSYTADTPKLPDRLVDPTQPTAAEYEATHTDVHAGYAPAAGGLPDGAVFGSATDTAGSADGGVSATEAERPTVPSFGIFLAMPGDETGSMTVTQPPGSHHLTGANTYLVQHRDSTQSVDFDSALTVNQGTAHDLGLNEVAVFADGSVLDLVIRFVPDDGAGEASANTAAVASIAAKRWGQHLSNPHNTH